ncbi:hypothetical protein GW17_00031534 [Ensete ventricosum]|nr:hypothetical protein GW17_00031534 [Ensete ventricosum]
MARSGALYLLSYNSLQSLGWLSRPSSSSSLLSCSHLYLGISSCCYLTGRSPSPGSSAATSPPNLSMEPTPSPETSSVANAIDYCYFQVIRYPHYALSCIGISLSWLTYLRFVILT